VIALTGDGLPENLGRLGQPGLSFRNQEAWRASVTAPSSATTPAGPVCGPTATGRWLRHIELLLAPDWLWVGEATGAIQLTPARNGRASSPLT
jgi:hypothetical protein